MKTDSYFEIGTTHDVCQDYALTGKINQFLSFAIVSDGCSESHRICGEVDFGARIMAYAARDVLLNLWGNNNLDSLSEDPEIFKGMGRNIRSRVWSNILPIRDQLRLHPMFSDCTLVVAITDGTTVYSYIYGDGAVIVNHINGEISYDEITYMSSAPYYIVYSYDNDRNNAYKIAYGSSPVIHSNYVIPIGGDVLSAKVSHKQAPEINEDIYVFSSFMYKDISSVTITSDGIKSYQSMVGEAKDIPPISMVPKFIGFKNTNGAFVQRRMKMLKKENDFTKISHYDDVSVASIIV